MPRIVTGNKPNAPPPRIRTPKEVVKKGFPSWVKVLVRGYIAIGIVALFSVMGWFDMVAGYLKLEPRAFSIFIFAGIGMAMLFGIGYLLVTKHRRAKGVKEADIPSMVILFIKVVISIGLIYLAEYLGLIPSIARELLVSLFSVGWAIYIAGSFIYNVFRRAQ